MESVNPLKTLNFPGFRARARPRMDFLIIFMILVIVSVNIYQIKPKNFWRNHLRSHGIRKSVENAQFSRISRSGAATHGLFDHFQDSGDSSSQYLSDLVQKRLKKPFAEPWNP